MFQTTLAWALFALLYVALLRRETFFHANRAYLLGTLILGLLLPVLAIYLPASGMLYRAILPAFTVEIRPEAQDAGSWSWSDLLVAVYAVGALVSGMRLLWGLGRVTDLLVQGETQAMPDGCRMVYSEKSRIPFSFFHWIVVPGYYLEGSASDLEAMLAHERAHARGWHSVDVLVLELLCVLFWFHPLVHWYRRALRTVHEYLADAEAARQTDRKQYALLLLRQSGSAQTPVVANHFFQSPLKQRLLMLTQRDSHRLRRWRYALLAPTLALLAWLQPSPDISAQPDEPVLQLFDADQMPEFPGGESEMFKYLGTNLQYPKTARTSKIQGVVYLTFIIENDGSVSNVRSISDKVDASLAAEAIRAVSGMPRWKPAEKGGKPVRVQFTLPVKFKLE